MRRVTTAHPAPPHRPGDRRRTVAVFAATLLVIISTATSCSGRRSDGVAVEPGKTGATGPVATTQPDGGSVRALDGSVIEIARDLPGVPAGWPPDVQIPDGATSLSASEFAASAQGSGRSIAFESTRSATDVVDFYRARLAADGWTIDAEVPTTTGAVLSASKTDAAGTTRTTFVTVSDDSAATPGGTKVVVATTG